MVFSSTVFLFVFLPVVLILLFLLKKELRNVFLLLASLLFYAWGEGYLVVIMLMSILINFLAGILLDHSFKRPKAVAQIVLGVAIAINLTILIYYKYFGFIFENIQSIGFYKGVATSPIHLPIGISFFTFQSISYLVDVYRRETKAQHNPINLGLYISLFPQLIAGPIVRYHDIAQQIDHRTITAQKFASGVSRFVQGLGKKVIIANSLALIADEAFAINASELPALVAWLGIVCYALQIYFDFSGYSDMAIGLGRMMGFDFLENFRYPYISNSVQEFWRRWHISLSTWFRDYLYVPLGGNRHGTFATYRNLLIVFFLTGLWHGASWNFIVWGMFHGLFLIFERLGLRNILNKTPRFIQHLYLLLVVLIGWVFFRSPDLTYAFKYLRSMAGLMEGNNYYPFVYFDYYRVTTLVLAIVLSTPIVGWVVNKLRQLPPQVLPYFRPLYLGASYFSVLAILFLCVIELAQNNYNPFIYFRF